MKGFGGEVKGGERSLRREAEGQEGQPASGAVVEVLVVKMVISWRFIINK